MLYAMRRPMTAIRASGSVEHWEDGERVRADISMFVERPDRVRIDAMTPVGRAATLTSDGTRFQLSDLRAGRFLEGPACAGNLARLGGLALEPADAVRLLLGEPPRFAGVAASLLCTHDGTYGITQRDATGRSAYIEIGVRESDFDRPAHEQHLRLLSVEVRRPDGALDWRARYDAYRVVRDRRSARGLGIAFAHRIVFERPSLGVRTTVRFDEVAIGVEVPPGAFEQRPRRGLRVERVDCPR